MEVKMLQGSGNGIAVSGNWKSCLIEVENLPHGSGKAVSWKWKNCLMKVESFFIAVEKLSHKSNEKLSHGSEKAVP